VRKQHPKIRSIQGLRTNANVSKPSIVEEQSNFTSQVRRWIIDLVIIGLVILAIGVFFFEMWRKEIILDAIDVPDDLVKLGYTGVVVAEKLADESQKIRIENRDLSAKNSWHKETENVNKVEATTNKPDISLPETQTTIRSITRFIHQEFGFNLIYIRGEIVVEKNNYVLSLRKISGVGDSPAERVSKSKEKIDQLFSEGGKSLLKLTTPSAIAINAYNKFVNELSKPPKEDNNFTKVVEAFKYCIKYAPKHDKSLAYTLWGNALIYLNKPLEAIDQYNEAIDADPNNAYAYNSWGNALNDLNKPLEAIEQYNMAIDADEESPYAYNGMGNVLRKQKKPLEAIKQFEKAIGADPNYAYAYINLATTLVGQNNPLEAIKQLKKASNVDRNNAYIYDDLGNAYFDNNDPENAMASFEKAIKIDPKFAKGYQDLGSVLHYRERHEEARKNEEKAKLLEKTNNSP